MHIIKYIIQSLIDQDNATTDCHVERLLQVEDGDDGASIAPVLPLEAFSLYVLLCIVCLNYVYNLSRSFLFALISLLVSSSFFHSRPRG